MGGGGGGWAGCGGPGGAAPPPATWGPGFTLMSGSLGSGGGGGAPTWNRLRRPPSMFTACTLASRSKRRVGSMVMGSTRSSGRFCFKDGRNSSLDRDDEEE